MIHIQRLFVGILGVLLTLSLPALLIGLIYVMVSDGMEALKLVSELLFLLGVLMFAYLLGKDILK